MVIELAILGIPHFETNLFRDPKACSFSLSETLNKKDAEKVSGLNWQHQRPCCPVAGSGNVLEFGKTQLHPIALYTLYTLYNTKAMGHHGFLILSVSIADWLPAWGELHSFGVHVCQLQC